MSNNHHDNHHEEEQHEFTYGTPILVFLGLVSLTCMTVSSTVLHLSHTAAILVTMTISVIESALMVAFFMHLKYEKNYIILFFGIPVVILIIIYLWTFSDYPFRVYN